MNSSVTIRNAASSLVWTDARIAGDPAHQHAQRRAPLHERRELLEPRFRMLRHRLSCRVRIARRWTCSIVLVHLRPRSYISRSLGKLPVRTPPRILIVDDNPTNVKVLQTRLVADGYEVVTAGDGEEGLAAACATRPT